MHTHLVQRALAPPFKYIADFEETPSKERASGKCLELSETSADRISVS